MSIIMPGKMPDRCTSCVFCDDYFDDGDFGLCCSISGSRIYGRERLKDCPVIELPPHGDLVDRDHLSVVCYTGAEGLEDTFDNGVAWTLEYIDKLTPVIPAEGGAENE